MRIQKINTGKWHLYLDDVDGYEVVNIAEIIYMQEELDNILSEREVQLQKQINRLERELRHSKN